jgi:hypothetical protein
MKGSVLKICLGVAAIATVTFSALFWGKSFSNPDSILMKRPTPAAPEVGTEVPLMLIKELESGVTPEGSPVSFIVTEDVRSSGGTAIKEGTIVRGKVSWTRRERMMDGLAGRPARLNVEFDPIHSQHGFTVMLGGDEEDNSYAFNRSNTGPVSNIPVPKENNTKGQDIVESVRQKLLSEDVELTDDDLRKVLDAYAGEMRLEATGRIVAQNELKRMNQLIQIAKSNSGSADLLTGDLGLAVAAVSELTSLANHVGRQLDRALSGRNIKAYIGTPVRVKVVEVKAMKTA